MDNLCSIIIGLGTSILGSLLIWIVLNRILVPKIALSEKILCTTALTKEGKKQYKLVVTNLSKREAYDIILLGRFILFGLDKDNLEAPKLFVAKVGTGKHPYLPRKPKKKDISHDNQRRFLVRPTKDGKSQLMKLYDLDENEVDVARILHANPKNYLEITVTCTHSASSARKITRKKYFFNNVADYDISPKDLGSEDFFDSDDLE